MKRNSCLLLALLLSLACNPVEQSVKLEMPQKESLAIGSYETIYLLDFLLNLSDKSYDPRIQIRQYFSDEFAAASGRKIQPLTIAEWDQLASSGAGQPAASLADSTFFQKLLHAYPHALFLTGKISAEMKSTSVIQVVQDEQGKRKSTYVTKQIWNAEARMVLVDSDTGKVLSDKTLTDKQNPETADTPRFLFGQLLDRIGDRLLPDFQKRSKIQERYILLK